MTHPPCAPYLTSGLYSANLSRYSTALPSPTLMKPMRGMSCREREREMKNTPNKMNIYQGGWRVKGRADNAGRFTGEIWQSNPVAGLQYTV